MNVEKTILLVDRDHDFLNWAKKHLAADGIRILCCDNADNADKVCQKTKVHLVIAELQVTPFDGIELLQRLKARHPNIVFILTAGFPGTAQIIKASQAGAHDILGKEALTFELRSAVESGLNSVEALLNSASEPDKPQLKEPGVTIIGNSKSFQNVFKIVGRVARTTAPVLVSGESGTGKELVATSLHQYSDRRKQELVALNCGAIPENLLESELFGHEKGSFTGAASKRIGRFEQCDKGTLFLDEIGDMPLQVQVKLLRVLQEGTFSRVGGNETLKCDVRIVAATNKNLAQEVTLGNFREDLYYRLNVVELKLPPLRERKEDIPLLAEFFLQKITRKNGMARIRLSGEAGIFLQQHHWPGNVRELENTMARACALAATDTLLPQDIPIGTAIQKNIVFQDLLEQLLLAKPDQEQLLTWVSEQLAQAAFEFNEDKLPQTAKMLGCTAQKLRSLLKNAL